MNRLSDNFETRPDNRAGDIIWPEELQPQDDTRRIEWALGLTVAAVFVGGGAAWAKFLGWW